MPDDPIMDRMVSRNECHQNHLAITAAIRDLRQDVKADLHEALDPITTHLRTLNGRTSKNEVAVAVLKTQMALLGGGLGLLGGLISTLVLDWLKR